METPLKTSRECALIAARAADERKASDIVVVHVGDVIDVTDYFVIVTAANTPQVEAVLDSIEEKVRHILAVLVRPGASDRNRTCNPLITNQLRYRCATLAKKRRRLLCHNSRSIKSGNKALFTRSPFLPKVILYPQRISVGQNALILLWAHHVIEVICTQITH